jgi:tetratricopeptide (TPR) repeat protein
MKKYILAITLLITATSVAHSQSEPPFGMSELAAYAIFYENFRTGDWEMARMYGRWMLEKKPETIQGYNRFELPRQFDRLITVYAELSKKQTDPTMRSAYIDTALAIFDDTFATFDENQIDYYSWHFNKGRFYQENQSQIRDGMNLAYQEYEKAFELDPERLTQAANGYYIQILLSHYTSQNNRESALEMIDIAEQYAGSELASAIDEVRDGLFTNPQERIEFLEGRLENNPGDMGLITELASMYERAGNREKAIEFARKLYDIEPSFQNIRRLADYAKADGQNRVAIQYLNEAVEVTEDRDIQKNILLEVSELHQNEGNLQEARRFARQASQLDRNWGQPFIRIARIYASAISQCSAGRQIDRDDRAVYWLVLDYLDRARSVDSSLEGTVTREYRTYTPALPSAEDKFFRGWETGETIQIGGNISDCYAWINETTTVR